MKYISTDEINSYDRFYRANLINSISGLKPVNLIGTINQSGVSNVAVFSSVMHLGANPALLAFVQRPIMETSHTYKNILANNFYTINHVHTAIVENAHFTSAKFDDDVSEFEACGLTAAFKNDFMAPYVAESAIQLGMELVEMLPIKHNGTTLVIGKIVAIHINETLIEAEGNINLEQSKSLTAAGLETYYTSAKVAKYPYAQVASLPNFCK